MELKDVKIETGMIIVMKNRKGLVLDNEVFYFGRYTGSNTIAGTLENYDVLKILKPNTPKNTNLGANLIAYLDNRLGSYNDIYMDVVWEKEPNHEEMTMEEICEAFGKQIKIVK